MSSRIETLAKAYKSSKPEIRTTGIINRVQLESALAEEEANQDVRRFSQGMELLQSTAGFAGEIRTNQRLAKRAGKEFGILDFLGRKPEAIAAAGEGQALQEAGKVMQDGIVYDAPAQTEQDAKAKINAVEKFRSGVQSATEKALGRKLTNQEIESGLSNQDLGADIESNSVLQYATNESVEDLGLEKKSPFSTLFEMLRGRKDDDE